MYIRTHRVTWVIIDYIKTTTGKYDQRTKGIHTFGDHNYLGYFYEKNYFSM